MIRQQVLKEFENSRLLKKGEIDFMVKNSNCSFQLEFGINGFNLFIFNNMGFSMYQNYDYSDIESIFIIDKKINLILQNGKSLNINF